MNRSDKYKAGAYIAIERGEYSDRDVIVFGRVLKTFDAKAECARWMVENPTDEDSSGETPNYYGFKDEAFVPWLIAQGFIEELDTERLHIGSYGRVGINGDY